MTFEQFIETYGVEITAQPITNRSENDDQWHKDASHFMINLTHAGRGFQCEYSCGSGIVKKHILKSVSFKMTARREGYTKPSDYFDVRFYEDTRSYNVQQTAKRLALKKFVPDLRDVLCSLQLDIMGVDQPFNDWCADYSYDDDSIKAKTIYDICVKHRFKLRSFFGANFDEFAQCEEA